MRTLIFRLLLFLSGLAFSTGCSSFHKEWREATRQPSPLQSISGPWTGTWQNTNNTHSDKLRVVISDLGGQRYRAHFHAHYKKIFTFAYVVNFEAQPDGVDLILVGQEDLGKLAGGIYKYNGRANPTNFFCNYDSKYDTGTFTLHRP
jgi:hypothetical protein